MKPNKQSDAVVIRKETDTVAVSVAALMYLL
jgi:hypothetical protein